jgi:transcriptional regulator with GAF, ATPase, and Fis domain
VAGVGVTHTLTVFAPDPQRAVFGLVATDDASAALLAQLEAALSGAPRTGLTRETIESALAQTGSIRGASKLLGYARSTVRAAAQRTGVRS